MTAPSVALLPVDLAHPVDRSWLVAFLTTNRFPFHVTSAPTRDGVERRVADGDFSGPAHALFRVEADGAAVGMVALDDLDDGAPLIDVRLAERARGRGSACRSSARSPAPCSPGTPTSIGSRRRPGTTTSRCGRSWSGAGGSRRRSTGGRGPSRAAPRDSVAYGLLREDHRSGRVTPFYGRFDAGE